VTGGRTARGVVASVLDQIKASRLHRSNNPSTYCLLVARKARSRRTLRAADVTNDLLKVRVRRTDSGMATVYSGRRSFAVARALEFDDLAPLPSAAAYLLGALGADLLLIFSALADRQGVNIHNAEVAVVGQLNNALAFLGVIGEAGHPGYESIQATLFVGSDASDDVIGEVCKPGRQEVGLRWKTKPGGNIALVRLGNSSSVNRRTLSSSR
jgi:hypothetical protein